MRDWLRYQVERWQAFGTAWRYYWRKQEERDW